MQQSKGVTSKNNSLTSVGIDIGTTSCHLVFSRLSLVNEASATQIPRLVIGEREVVYESPIYFTPLNSDGSIDGARVAELMRSEYLQARITPDDINCGAVIITGETARLRNAEEVLHQISSLSGDFVAASAGPELESILSGRGSGALQHSKESGQTICNIDIGGGTTNIAVFQNGALIETSCLRIGGRCFQFSSDGVLTDRSEYGSRLARSVPGTGNESGLTPGANVPREVLMSLANNAAKQILDFVCLPNIVDGLDNLILGIALSHEFPIDEYWFSGGVAELMRTLLAEPGCSIDANSIDPFLYGDFGYFLASAICVGVKQRALPFRIAQNPIRATVVGAGSYSVQLSGNTVSAATSNLPLKGVPLIRLNQTFIDVNDPQPEEISNYLTKAIAGHDKKASEKSFAIILHFDNSPRYADLRKWASALAIACKQNTLCLPYIFIVNTDSAMALGQLMRGQLKHDSVIVLDGIDLSTGDFIDIGKPIGTGSTIPVTVKSLIFSND